MAAPRIITSSAIIANVNVAVGMQDMNPNILSWSLRTKRSNPFKTPSLWLLGLGALLLALSLLAIAEPLGCWNYGTVVR